MSTALRDVAEARVCVTADEVSRNLATSDVALVTEEALDREALRALGNALRTQPSWSDFPFVVLTGRASTAGENRLILAALTELGNVTTLERPVHPLTLISAVRSALRARGRQHRTRELLTQLEESLHQRDAFLAMLGHELRNPLGAIGNAVELAVRARDRSAPPDRQLTIIQRQVQVLSRLVNDLLDVSRVTSGKVALQREPVDLVALLDRLLAQASVEARERQLHLSLSTEHEPAVVTGDAVRLEQIFSNLLSNAIKYTPPRGRIEVALARDARYVTVRVTDSGVGIPADALPRIFDLFAQADTSLDRAQGGMGIGLTLVQSLAQLHGGTVRAKSEGVGKGSEFSVTLPLAADTRPQPSERRPDAVEATGRRVLLVEDNHDNRTTLRELLEFAGHQVTLAATGPEGVALALEHRPEVALVDIGLPGLDGYQVAQRIRSALGESLVLIALTGYGQPEDVRRARAAGFDAHLAKPLDLDTLQALIVRQRARG